MIFEYQNCKIQINGERQLSAEKQVISFSEIRDLITFRICPLLDSPSIQIEAAKYFHFSDGMIYEMVWAGRMIRLESGDEVILNWPHLLGETSEWRTTAKFNTSRNA